MAFDRETGTQLAWNQIVLSHDIGADEFKRIYKEISILKQISHPNIIKLYDSWIDEEKGNLIFVTEAMTSGWGILIVFLFRYSNNYLFIFFLLQGRWRSFASGCRSCRCMWCKTGPASSCPDWTICTPAPPSSCTATSRHVLFPSHLMGNSYCFLCFFLFFFFSFVFYTYCFLRI
jgi:serine/threonine protein kinase